MGEPKKRGTGAEVSIEKRHYEYLEEHARNRILEPAMLLEELIENGDRLWEGDGFGEEEEEEIEIETVSVEVSRRHYGLLAEQAARRGLETEEYAEILIEIGAKGLPRDPRTDVEWPPTPPGSGLH